MLFTKKPSSWFWVALRGIEEAELVSQIPRPNIMVSSGPMNGKSNPRSNTVRMAKLALSLCVIPTIVGCPYVVDGPSVACDGPDPAASRIDFEIVDRTGEFSGTVRITGVVSNDGTLSAWQINVGRNGTLVVGESAGASTDQIVVAEGNVSGDGTLTGDVFNGGSISPLAQGDPTGILTLDGDYEQLVEGTLVIELAGLVPGAQYDRLVVTGAAELAGTLDLRLLDGFVPTIGDQFTILTADAGVIYNAYLCIPQTKDWSAPRKGRPSTIAPEKPTSLEGRFVARLVLREEEGVGLLVLEDFAQTTAGTYRARRERSAYPRWPPA